MKKSNLFTATLFTIFALLIIVNVWTVDLAKGNLLDFGSFLASGIYASVGENPYNDSHPYIFEVDIPVVGAGGRLPNLNPPISVLLFERFANADPFKAFTFWKTLSTVVYLLAISILGIRYKTSPERFFWLFVLAGAWHTVKLGQVYTFLLFFIVLIWIFSEKDQDAAAGIFLGLLISIKPNFILWLGLAMIARKWKFSLTAMTSLAFVSLIPLQTNGIDIYQQWLNATKVSNAILRMPGNSSLIGLTSRTGNSTLGIVISLLIAAILAWNIFLKKRLGEDIRLNHIHELGIVLSLIASPITWVGYTILLVPIFISRKKWSGWLKVSAVLLAIPTIISFNLYLQSELNFVFWGWIYGFPLIFSLLEILKVRFSYPPTFLKQRAT